ncbi:porin, partial [Pseudomonas aeruginosa]
MAPLASQGEYLARKLRADGIAYKDIKAKGYYQQQAFSLKCESPQDKVEGAKLDSWLLYTPDAADDLTR